MTEAEFQKQALALGLKLQGASAINASLPRTDDPKLWTFWFTLGWSTKVNIQWYVGGKFYNLMITELQFQRLDKDQLTKLANTVAAANTEHDNLMASLKALPVTVKELIKAKVRS